MVWYNKHKKKRVLSSKRLGGKYMENKNYDDNLGIVKISDEVVSVIAGIAAEEINGVED